MKWVNQNRMDEEAGALAPEPYQLYGYLYKARRKWVFMGGCLVPVDVELVDTVQHAFGPWHKYLVHFLLRALQKRQDKRACRL